MLKETMRSQMESSSVRSAPWPSQNVAQNQALSQRAGRPMRLSASEAAARFQRPSMDVRWVVWRRRPMGWPVQAMSS